MSGTNRTVAQTPGLPACEMFRRDRWLCWLRGPFRHDFQPYKNDTQILVCSRCGYGFWNQTGGKIL